MSAFLLTSHCECDKTPYPWRELNPGHPDQMHILYLLRMYVMIMQITNYDQKQTTNLQNNFC
jgi:hypothetical protein